MSANIAEGSRRQWPIDYTRFLNLSQGSLAELEWMILVARDLGYLTVSVAEDLLFDGDEISKMLTRFRMAVLKSAEM